MVGGPTGVAIPDTVIDLLCELVRIPSINPAFAPARPEWTGESRIRDYLAGLAIGAGLEVREQTVAEGRSNLLVTLPARGERHHRILLAPHLDTVGITDPSQLVPERRNRRIQGRGACDTKGSVAVFFHALLQLALREDRPLHTEIVFAGLCDEEHHQLGSWGLARDCPEADLAIIGEPTRLDVVTAHKGDLWLRIETRGRAAHGARPACGRSAIREMALFVDALETSHAEALRRRQHPLLGAPTVNVGTIQGGQQANIVPDRCHILVDRRTLPGESFPSVRSSLLELAREVGIKVWITDERKVPAPSLETDPSLPEVREFLRRVGRKKACGVDYYCDAAAIASAGVPCVVFGPGNIDQAHSRQEWISQKELESGLRKLLLYLESRP